MSANVLAAGNRQPPDSLPSSMSGENPPLWTVTVRFAPEAARAVKQLASEFHFMPEDVIRAAAVLLAETSRNYGLSAENCARMEECVRYEAQLVHSLTSERACHVRPNCPLCHRRMLGVRQDWKADGSDESNDSSIPEWIFVCMACDVVCDAKGLEIGKWSVMSRGGQ